MSYSRSQLHEEISTLTTEARLLEIEISARAQQNPLRKASGPRWLTLSPYLRAKEFFYLWDEQNMESSGFQRSGNADSEKETSGMSQENRLTSSDSGSTVGTLEHEQCRVLGILKCYHFNLEMGTLSGGEEVPEELLIRLERILQLAADDGDCKSIEENVHVAGIMKETKRGRSTDEEKLVVEMIDGYIRELRRCGGEVDRDLEKYARKILERRSSPGRGLEAEFLTVG